MLLGGSSYFFAGIRVLISCSSYNSRFWLMDCRNISEATKYATELYREAIHVPFMAK